MGTATMFWMMTTAAVMALMTACRAMMDRAAQQPAMRPAPARSQRHAEAHAQRTDPNRIPSEWN